MMAPSNSVLNLLRFVGFCFVAGLLLLLQGAATVRKLLPGVVSVFLVAESEAQLVARLVSRKTEPMDKMLTRVQTAR
jgi:guanylate kinase